MADEDGFARRVTRLGALADPVRRALYRFVVAQDDAVSRDQAAGGVDVPRHTARHHLERLVDEGLLITEFRRLTGRTGPGAGRPAKLYRRADREVAVSVPHRRYDIAGHVLADAVERSLAGEPIDVAVRGAAQEAGARAARVSAPASGVAPLERLADVLAGYGYEPRCDGELELGNCPFEQLSAEHTDLVCGVNLTFVQALADRLGCHGVRVDRDDGGLGCCVRVVPTSEPAVGAGEPSVAPSRTAEGDTT
jgi:predicted ArsR family transcriptional regulator